MSNIQTFKCFGPKTLPKKKNSEKSWNTHEQYMKKKTHKTNKAKNGNAKHHDTKNKKKQRREKRQSFYVVISCIFSLFYLSGLGLLLNLGVPS